MREPNITPAHQPIIELQKEMLADPKFKDLCLKHGLPWNPAGGYEPRYYGGPAPEEVRVLYISAEPGPITEKEKLDLLPAVAHFPIMDFDLTASQHYWRKDLHEFCESIWPEDTTANMDNYLGMTASFWMSPPEGQATDTIPVEVLDYFHETYFKRFLKLFPKAIKWAVGAKARDRLKRHNVNFIHSASFMKPAGRYPSSLATWPAASSRIKEILEHRYG